MFSSVKKIVLDGIEMKMLRVTFLDGKISDVPKDDNNRHYQEILAWVADGNTIEEAD